jgi:hypothetical protein
VDRKLVCRQTCSVSQFRAGIDMPLFAGIVCASFVCHPVDFQWVHSRNDYEQQGSVTCSVLGVAPHIILVTYFTFKRLTCHGEC